VEPDQERFNSIYRAHATKKKTSVLFFGLLRDRSGEEQQVVKYFWVHFCGTGSGRDNPIYHAHAIKKKTSALFFSLLCDRSGEEQQVGNTSGFHFCGTRSGKS
jgi:hypothetical protein